MTSTAAEPQTAEAPPIPARGATRPRWERFAPKVDFALFLGGVAGLLLVLPHEIGGDGEERAKALTQLMTDGALSTNPYSLIGPLFAAPLWAVDRDWLLFYNLFVFVTALVATYAWLRRRADPALLRRTGVILVGASVVAPALANFYGEAFTLAGLGLGTLAAVRRGSTRADRVGRAVGWIAVVLGAANTPATLPALAVTVCLWAFWHKRLRYAIALLAAAALVSAEKWLRYGSPSADPYAGTNDIAVTVMPYSGHGGFSYPIFFGLLGILFSFGKGLVWYLPGLLLPARQLLGRAADELRDAYVLWSCQVGVLVLFYAAWWSWYGGLYWGPRFFLIGILPASLALAANLGDRAAGLAKNLAVLGVTTLSCWVGLAAVVFPGFPRQCTADYFQQEYLCHFTPEFSALWRPFVTRPELDGGQLTVVAYTVVLWVWLAAPLVARIAREIGGRAPRLRDLAVGWRW
ncbi:MAG: hypothetical protein HOV79_13875 [Hamadaea sp.]|nr:hypothetical protein [Hamadaea sp.]